jgi:K+-sensing histidine kinase KdpD
VALSFWVKLQFLARLLRQQQAKFFTRYLLPVLAVFLALEANWAMASYVSFLPPFWAFLAAIMVTTWYGGFSSGVFAVIPSTVITDYYFIPPIFAFSVKPRRYWDDWSVCLRSHHHGVLHPLSQDE